MKINSISSNYYFQTQSRNTKSNENEKVVNQSDLKTVDSSKLALAFKANLAAGHRRVVLENKETKMAYDKMVQILKKLPDSAKMTKPILIKVGEENLGFSVDLS